MLGGAPTPTFEEWPSPLARVGRGCCRRADVSGERTLAQAKGASSGMALRLDHAWRAPLQDPDAAGARDVDGDQRRDGGAPASSGEEVIVAEEVAAFLVRQRAAEVIEVIEPGDPGPEAE